MPASMPPPLSGLAPSLLFENLPIGAYRSTPEGQLLRANAAMVRLAGCATEAELLAVVTDLSVGWYVSPGRRAEFKRLIAEHGQVVDFVSEMHRQGSTERLWVREAAYAVYDEHGQVLYYEGTLEDISDSVRAQQLLAESEARWRMALEAAGDGVWDWHIPTGVEYCSDRLLHMFGYLPGELANAAAELDSRTHPDDLAQMAADREAHFSGWAPSYINEHRVQCKDGRWKWVLTRGMVVERDAQGKPLRMVGTHTDISARKQAEALIWQQAHFDTLTGLPNRRMLRDRLDEHLQRCTRLGQPLAIMFIDLDHFKEVNDTLGHDRGDQLLVQAAQRIARCMGPANTVARMGGDEFTVLVTDLAPGLPPSTLLHQRLQSLLDDLAQVFDLGPDQVFVSASVGVALYPTDGEQADDLLKHADQALYAAKTAGRNRYRFFTPVLQEAAQTRARLDLDLRNALAEGQLEVVFQPIVELATGRVHKAEALLRWHHPTRGDVSPAQFIPIAESNGQIVPIGDWVFRQVAQQVARWRRTLHPQFQVGVNKSPVQFHRHLATGQGDWAALVEQLGLDGSSLAVEITEGLLLDTSAAVTDILSRMRAQGMAVSLDDFGTGYSSLTYLQKLDIDYIKIDRSFVCNLRPGATELALCKAMIVMAHELGIRVVAEGVETEEQCTLLKQAGCDFAQGYWLARPLPVAEFESFWHRHAGGAVLP
ncbi:putative bifunctional diguanylate cyclase/phosphodiesterase [Hydrogenophaga soli]